MDALVISFKKREKLKRGPSVYILLNRKKFRVPNLHSTKKNWSRGKQ